MLSRWMLLAPILLVATAIACNPNPQLNVFCSTKCPDSELQSCLTCNFLLWTEAPCATSYPLGVQYVDLQFNEIETITALAFANVTSLLVIDLKFNHITSIDSDSFDTLTELQQLYIANNQLNYVDPFLLIHLSNLQLFFAMNNQLSYLEPIMFSTVSSLLLLDLHQNNLTSIHPDTFAHLGELQQMSLRSNPYTSLQPTTFRNQTLLQQLYLYDTGLTSIPSGLFSNLTSLQTLDLSYNSGVILNIEAFQGIPYTPPTYDIVTGNQTGLWLVSNSNLTIHSNAFGDIVTFFCGTTYTTKSSQEVCEAAACMNQCGPDSLCSVDGFLTPESVFSCQHALVSL